MYILVSPEKYLLCHDSHPHSPTADAEGTLSHAPNLSACYSKARCGHMGSMTDRLLHHFLFSFFIFHHIAVRSYFGYDSVPHVRPSGPDMLVGVTWKRGKKNPAEWLWIFLRWTLGIEQAGKQSTIKSKAKGNVTMDLWLKFEYLNVISAGGVDSSRDKTLKRAPVHCAMFISGILYYLSRPLSVHSARTFFNEFFCCGV